MVFLVIPLSGFQPFCDKIDIPFGRPDAGRRLLLERVQDVHGLLEPYYKVQHRDGVTLAWKDFRKEVFSTLEEARAFIDAARLNEPTRILEFNGGRSTIVNEQR